MIRGAPPDASRRSIHDLAHAREGTVLRQREPAAESTSRHVALALLREAFARDAERGT